MNLVAKPTFSPDGRLLADVSMESGPAQVCVTRFPGPGEMMQVSTGGGSNPVGSRDGHGLFCQDGDTMMRATASSSARLVVGKPEAMFPARFWHAPIAGPHFDIAPDGKRFLSVHSAREASSIQVHLVSNWTSQLNR